MTGLYNPARKLAATVAVLAVLSGSALAATISQGFTAAEKLVAGTIVAVQSGTAVTAADSDHADSLIGVVVDSNASTVAVGSAGTSVQVVTTGVVNTFVSDINGAVKSGDQITASPIKGVGMKATNNGKIIGVSQSNLDAAAAKSVSVKSKDGKTKTVKVGMVPVAISAAYYVSASGNGIVPPALQALANTVGQKNVSVVRVLLAFLLVLIGLIVVTILVFSSVRSAIISIGRNPLAQADIYKGLLQVLIISVAILGAALGAAYLAVKV